MRLTLSWKPLLITLAGVGCFLLLASANATPLENTPHGLQFALFYAGILLLIIGLGIKTGETHIRFGWNEAHRHEVFIVIGVFILALVLRLWQLADRIRAPVDEVLPMTEILALWDNPNLPIIRQFGVISSLTRLFASWQGASAAIFGHNLLALRIPSAVIGSVTVAATYFCGRVLFDRKTALVGGLLLATFPPHMHFSRIGILSIGDPLFGTLAFACLVLAFKHNQRLSWVFGGIALGLTQYFYEGGRLLYPAFMLVVVILTLLTNRAKIREWTVGLSFYALTAIVIAAPIYLTIALLNDPFSTRMNTLALSRNDWLVLLTSPPSSPAFDYLVRHTIDPLLLFINRPDPTPYYGGATALILIFLVPMFLVGLIASLWNRHGRGLVVWFLLTWAGNLLMVDSALAARYVVVFPAVALLMAVGIMRVSAWLPAKYRTGVIGIYLAFCLVTQTGYYFGPHLSAYMQTLVPGRDAYDALLRAVDLPAGTSVYLVDPPSTVTEQYAGDILRFMAADKSIQLIGSPDTFNLSQESSAAPYAFFIPADDTQTPLLLKQSLNLDEPQFTTYPLSEAQAYVLYMGRPR